MFFLVVSHSQTYVSSVSYVLFPARINNHDVIMHCCAVELKREVAAWERTASRMPAISVEDKAIRETLRAKAMEVSHQISEHIVE